jgi:hypothetical protein
MKAKVNTPLAGLYFQQPTTKEWRWVLSSQPGFLISTPVGSDGLPDNISQKLQSFRDLANVEFVQTISVPDLTTELNQTQINKLREHIEGRT